MMSVRIALLVGKLWSADSAGWVEAAIYWVIGAAPCIIILWPTSSASSLFWTNAHTIGISDAQFNVEHNYMLCNKIMRLCFALRSYVAPCKWGYSGTITAFCMEIPIIPYTRITRYPNSPSLLCIDHSPADTIVGLHKRSIFLMNMIKNNLTPFLTRLARHRQIYAYATSSSRIQTKWSPSS